MQERDEILRAIYEAVGKDGGKISGFIFGEIPPKTEELFARLVPRFNATDLSRIEHFVEQDLRKAKPTARVEELEHREFRTLRTPSVENLGLETRAVGPALIEIKRDTQEYKVVDPAPIVQYVREDRVSGHRKFFGDLITTIKFENGIVSPLATAVDFARAAPCPLFDYKGIENFCQGAHTVLRAAETVKMSSPDKARHLASVLNEMPIETFLNLQAMFYIQVMRVKSDEQGFILMESSPLRLTFSVREDAMKYPSIGLDKRSCIFRESQVKITPTFPKDDLVALRQLMEHRTYRGEDLERLSVLTKSWNEGGLPPKVQVQVCSALSVIVPLATKFTEKEIYIRPTSKALVPHLEHALGLYNVAHTYHLSSREALAVRQLIENISYVEKVPEDCVYVDLCSMEIPTVAKGQDLKAKWLALHQEMTPKTKIWVAFRKILPSLMGSCSTYFFQMTHSHAFDVIETNQDTLDRIRGEVVYSREDRKFNVKTVVYPATKLTPDILLNLQFEENRKKTSILQGTWKYRVDETLNLWELPIVFTKRDMKATKVEVESVMAPQDDRRRDNTILDVPQPQRVEALRLDSSRPPSPSPSAGAMDHPPADRSASPSPQPQPQRRGNALFDSGGAEQRGREGEERVEREDDGPVREIPDD